MDGYETINLTPLPWNFHGEFLVHMKSKGRWQVLEWWGDKYFVNADNLTHREAQALLKLMQ